MASTAVYTYLCYTVGLYIESGLQVFYFVMAIYGWISWNKTTNKDQKIIRWPLKYHVLNIGVSALVTYLLGYLMVTYTDQQNPYRSEEHTSELQSRPHLVCRLLL